MYRISGRNVCLRTVQYVRQLASGAAVDHILRVHRRFLGVRHRPFLRSPQRHDWILSDAMVQILLDRHRSSHLHSPSPYLFDQILMSIGWFQLDIYWLIFIVLRSLGRVHLLPGEIHSSDVFGLWIPLVGASHRRALSPIIHDLHSCLHCLFISEAARNTIRGLLPFPSRKGIFSFNIWNLFLRSWKGKALNGDPLFSLLLSPFLFVSSEILQCHCTDAANRNHRRNSRGTVEQSRRIGSYFHRIIRPKYQEYVVHQTSILPIDRWITLW